VEVATFLVSDLAPPLAEEPADDESPDDDSDDELDVDPLDESPDDDAPADAGSFAGAASLPFCPFPDSAAARESLR
jgi:hypothetical protein